MEIHSPYMQKMCLPEFASKKSIGGERLMPCDFRARRRRRSQSSSFADVMRTGVESVQRRRHPSQSRCAFAQSTQTRRAPMGDANLSGMCFTCHGIQIATPRSLSIYAILPCGMAATHCCRCQSETSFSCMQDAEPRTSRYNANSSGSPCAMPNTRCTSHPMWHHACSTPWHH